MKNYLYGFSTAALLALACWQIATSNGDFERGIAIFAASCFVLSFVAACLGGVRN